MGGPTMENSGTSLAPINDQASHCKKTVSAVVAQESGFSDSLQRPASTRYPNARPPACHTASAMREREREVLRLQSTRPAETATMPRYPQLEAAAAKSWTSWYSQGRRPRLEPQHFLQVVQPSSARNIWPPPIEIEAIDSCGVRAIAWHRDEEGGFLDHRLTRVHEWSYTTFATHHSGADYGA